VIIGLPPNVICYFDLARSQRETKRGGREGNTKEEKRREEKGIEEGWGSGEGKYSTF
jgi:hypothetical protein